MTKTPNQKVFVQSELYINKTARTLKQASIHVKTNKILPGNPVLTSTHRINLNRITNRLLTSRMANTASYSTMFNPRTDNTSKNWADSKNLRIPIDLPIYDSLLAEANQISSQYIQSDWLLVAEKCIISPSEVMKKPDTICHLQHTDEPFSLLTRGSISTFTGKAKAGKTTALALIIAPILKVKKVLWIDTEQGRYYSGITQSYILSMAGVEHSNNLQMVDLRPFTPPDKLQIIEALIKDQVYDLIVLDGVKDIVFDINNTEEATTIITKLMAWTVDYSCHIAMVLHYNKGNSDVRGHLGTEAINKSEVVVSITKTIDNPPAAMVSADFSRGLPFSNFYIKRNEEGVPYVDKYYNPIMKQITGRKNKRDPSTISPEIHKKVLNIVFKNEEELNSGTFRSALASAWDTVNGSTSSLGDTRAKIFQAFYGQSGYVEIKERQKGNITLIKFLHPIN